MPSTKLNMNLFHKFLQLRMLCQSDIKDYINSILKIERIIIEGFKFNKLNKNRKKKQFSKKCIKNEGKRERN